ncbi:hypothetical protein H5J25_13975 [Sphingomonas aliaeris]|uniref:DUF6894 domain-containing protein n=1 Tax=Sphingomonas aliaeris TaxID=2759526 RepID=A0A974NT72_9SPHN|nr:hypothetical protein H5J25_13975 [Sphingomonas aliaeris]
MPNYQFITVENGVPTSGAVFEMPNHKQAGETLKQFAGEMLKERDIDVFDTDISVELTTEDGMILYSISIFGAVAPSMPRF